MKKIGISIDGPQDEIGSVRALELAKEIGADAVDFDVNHYDYRKPDSPYSKSDEEIIAYFTKMREKAESLGLEIYQTHGRYRTWLPNSEDAAACIENARRDCLATSVLGAKYCVMHGVTTKAAGTEASPETMHEICYNVWSKILPFAKQYGVIIATETFGNINNGPVCDFFGHADEFWKLYQRICSAGDNADYFKICVDTGHSNNAVRFGSLSAEDSIRLFGKNIVCLHLNDNNGLADQHRPLMAGSINWNNVFEALDEVGYDGVYNLELNLSCFGKGFEKETAEFAVKQARFLLNQRA